MQKNNEFFFSWKEIADYLGISISTLRRNYKRWGIPIKLLPTEKNMRKRPFITIEALEKWKKNCTEFSLIKTIENRSSVQF